MSHMVRFSIGTDITERFLIEAIRQPPILAARTKRQRFGASFSELALSREISAR